MGVVVPIGFAQVSLRWILSSDAEPMVVTFGCEANGEETPAEIADAATNLWEGAGTAWAATEMAVGYQFGPAECTIMTDTGPQTDTGAAFFTGSSSGVLPPPNNTAVLIQKRTNRGGRAGRGRVYVPPAYLNENNVSANGTIVAAQVTAWQTSATDFSNAMLGAGFGLRLLHSEAAGPLNPDIITQLVVQPIVATQRTRLRR